MYTLLAAKEINFSHLHTGRNFCSTQAFYACPLLPGIGISFPSPIPLFYYRETLRHCFIAGEIPLLDRASACTPKCCVLAGPYWSARGSFPKERWTTPHVLSGHHVPNPAEAAALTPVSTSKLSSLGPGPIRGSIASMGQHAALSLDVRGHRRGVFLYAILSKKVKAKRLAFFFVGNDDGIGDQKLIVEVLEFPSGPWI